MIDKLRIGIQGGPGSFNDSALRSYLKTRNTHLQHTTSYLDTTDRVLQSLERDEIELGQFALFNSQAGLYEESLAAIGRFRFEVQAAHRLQITHCMMTQTDVSKDEIERIISHPEVFRQCQNTLANQFPDVLLEIGEGELTDPSRVGYALANGQLSRNTAVVSNGLIAELHDLQIVATNLQDTKNCFSTFLIVSKHS